ncbi:glycosyl transferase [Mycobacterium paraffinicum]|uniref:Glycosyl transferase n=1 Tax=Mycobacterium paraffinicum TaxID=53378 RepID=A0A1Q4HRG2_9MYCO|nr:glycosyltransferase [Mycobacterium paraffinicum]OJZ71359.1 glycosyl transferase [Mycobacterium paraffinicum]
MRVLLSTHDSRGAVEPLAALGVQLRALGAEVRVCAPPDQEFADLLAGIDLPLKPFGDSWRAWATGLRPSEADLRRHLDGLVAAQFDTVADAADGCDLLLATGFPPVAAGARSVAERLDIPYVYVSYQPTILPSPHHLPPTYAGQVPPGLIDNRVLWQMDAQHMHTLFGATLNDHRASFGLPPVDDIRDYALTERPWLAADPSLSPWPEGGGLDVVQTGAWLLSDERPLPAAVAAFLDAGPPPVYVGFGSMPMRAANDLSRAVVDAVRALGQRAILYRGWSGLSPIDDRDDCLTVGELNHRALFPRVAAVVHHGGAGTTTTAALAGAPQVLVPQGADQPYWAGRVAELGIGIAHGGPAPTVGSLTAALKAVLTPETRARASAAAATIRTDGALVAASLLLDGLTR